MTANRVNSPMSHRVKSSTFRNFRNKKIAVKKLTVGLGTKREPKRWVPPGAKAKSHQTRVITLTTSSVERGFSKTLTFKSHLDKTKWKSLLIEVEKNWADLYHLAAKVTLPDEKPNPKPKSKCTKFLLVNLLSLQSFVACPRNAISSFGQLQLMEIQKDDRSISIWKLSCQLTTSRFCWMIPYRKALKLWVQLPEVTISRLKLKVKRALLR